MSSDPIGLASANPGNPQSMNSYAYVLNNPLSFVDPTGLYCVWDDGSYDDDPENGGAGKGDCRSQGGMWIDGTSPGYSTDKNPDVAAFAHDLQFIQIVFEDSMMFMDNQGLRRPGTGILNGGAVNTVKNALNGVINNVESWGSSYLACKGQSYEVLSYLDAIPSGALKYSWTFTIQDDVTHTWVSGTVKDAPLPFSEVVIDPLYATFTALGPAGATPDFQCGEGGCFIRP
jgi:hypothetical protein